MKALPEVHFQMHSFEVSLGYESIARSTFSSLGYESVARSTFSTFEMYFGQRFHTPMKLQKNA
jgi:hypothetical protein